MKIKSDEIVNSFSPCRNISLFFVPIPSTKWAAREIPRRHRLIRYAPGKISVTLNRSPSTSNCSCPF